MCLCWTDLLFVWTIKWTYLWYYQVKWTHLMHQRTHFYRTSKYGPTNRPQSRFENAKGTYVWCDCNNEPTFSVCLNEGPTFGLLMDPHFVYGKWTYFLTYFGPTFVLSMNLYFALQWTYLLCDLMDQLFVLGTNLPLTLARTYFLYAIIGPTFGHTVEPTLCTHTDLFFVCLNRTYFWSYGRTYYLHSHGPTFCIP